MAELDPKDHGATLLLQEIAASSIDKQVAHEAAAHSNVDQEVAPSHNTHAHNTHAPTRSRWKRIKVKLIQLAERIILVVLSKCLGISPPPSPSSESRRV